MNIRTAILKAADSIEQNPNLFYFGAINLPDKRCGSPGCALGWIAFHMGFNDDDIANRGTVLNQADSALGGAGGACFDKLTDMVGAENWKKSADSCAKALRLYAEKYHPNTGIPQAILEIFEQPNEQFENA